MKRLIYSATGAFLFLLAGCSSEAEKRLEQIEKQNKEAQERYQQKAKELRKQLEEGKFASPVEGFEEALDKTGDQKGRDRRFDEWLTRAKVIEQTGLTEEEIDQMVLRGKLKSVRRPDLQTLYDPATVENLQNEIKENWLRRDRK